jgi:hypothetical protein
MRRPALRSLVVMLALGSGLAGPATAQIRVPGGVNRALSGPSPEIRRLLARVDSTRERFDRATRLLLKSSYVMEAVVATEEQRATIRRELASVDEREQRGGDNTVQLDAEDHATRLEAATQNRQYQQKQLSDAQAANVSAAAFNAALAGVIDALALNDARQLVGEAQSAASAMASEPANAVYANRLREAATVQLPAIVNSVPVQARLSSAIVGAARQASASNANVHVTEATAATDPPRRIDPNAI